MPLFVAITEKMELIFSGERDSPMQAAVRRTPAKLLM
jgi:hypothetical protein